MKKTRHRIEVMAKPNGEPGPGVDAQGRAVIDPTQNVLDLVDAAIKRLDDVADSAFRRQDDLREVEAQHIREILNIRAEYDRELREAESNRIDAIRAVDVGAVNRAAEVAATQATVLAAQLSATAEAARTNLVASLEPVQKDIQDLRKAQYEIAGAKANVGEVRADKAGVSQAQALLISAGVGLLALGGFVLSLINSMGK
jgi:hypothetical protein